jgi:hypothetical protein
MGCVEWRDGRWCIADPDSRKGVLIANSCENYSSKNRSRLVSANAASYRKYCAFPLDKHVATAHTSWRLSNSAALIRSSYLSQAV